MNVIQFKKPEEKEPTCSFCGAPKSQVKVLVGGPPCICDKCIAHAKKRLEESGK